MKLFFKISLVLILVTPFVITVVLYFQSQSRYPNNYTERGSIRIGYAVEIPYAFVNSRGEVTGESPETAKEILSRLGIRDIQWVQTDFDFLIEGLNSGRFDMIAAGMFITPDRAKAVAFSEPDFHVTQGLLSQRGRLRNVRSYYDLKRTTGIRIAVLSGSIEEKILLSAGIPDASLIHVPDAVFGKITVDKGIADCLALSAPTVRWMALNDETRSTDAIGMEPEPGSSPAKTGYGGFAVRLTDTDFLRKWNAEMARFIGSPEHLALISTFGFSRAELPGNVSTRMILGESE